jgi:hypothetical protein
VLEVADDLSLDRGQRPFHNFLYHKLRSNRGRVGRSHDLALWATGMRETATDFDIDRATPTTPAENDAIESQPASRLQAAEKSAESGELINASNLHPVRVLSVPFWPPRPLSGYPSDFATSTLRDEITPQLHKAFSHKRLRNISSS